MMASVDGRIDCAMTEQIESGDEYYEALAELGCPSLLMGRVTMQLHYAAAEPFVAKEPAPIGRQAVHVARRAGDISSPSIRTAPCVGPQANSTDSPCW